MDFAQIWKYAVHGKTLRKQGYCMTCVGDGIVRGGSIEVWVCPDCGGTGMAKQEEDELTKIRKCLEKIAGK